MKALGVGLGSFAWSDVSLSRRGVSAPRLVVRGRAASLASSQGVTSWHVSITHTDTVASAVVAAVS
jgi:holo-[acyl-carrier protein] synthase